MTSHSAPASVTIKDLHKSYGEVEVLKGIDINVNPGEVVCLIGPSGSGKSTLLRCVNLLETPNSGLIEVAGHSATDPDVNIDKMRTNVGMVFQQFNLFPHMTVLENLMEAPVLVQGRTKEDVLPEALELLNKVGLLEKKDVYPSRLSGGQQQRVAIARALAMKPAIMLFDEPTSSLDPELTGEVLKTMLNLAKEDMTMVVVTHEIAFAREAADRVLFLDNGEVLEEGKPEDILLNPQQPRLQNFLANLL